MPPRSFPAAPRKPATRLSPRNAPRERSRAVRERTLYLRSLAVAFAFAAGNAAGSGPAK